MDGNDALEGRIKEGLHWGVISRPGAKPRYGIPFLGDNNLFLSHLDLEDEDEPAMWLRALSRDEPGVAAARLYTSIDRADNTKTTSQLFVVEDRPLSAPPDASWVEMRST